MCAPTAAELAKEAGLSPAELQVLQSLQSRRGQIDDREKDLDTEVQLLDYLDRLARRGAWPAETPRSDRSR